MNVLLIVLALAAASLFAIPLAMLRAGIRRQERTGSLTSEPRNLCSVLTRWATGLSAELDGPTAHSRRRDRDARPGSRPVTDTERARRS
jgi:hypothetical protein